MKNVYLFIYLMIIKYNSYIINFHLFLISNSVISKANVSYMYYILKFVGVQAMNLLSFLLKINQVQADLMNEYEGKRISIENIHDDSEMLATDGESVYLTTDREIQLNSLSADFQFVGDKLIIKGKTLCAFGSPDMTVQLCKYIFRNREWQLIYTGTETARLLNKETSKCIGYSDNLDGDQALPLVDCDTKDYETIFKIRDLNRVDQKDVYRPQRGPVNLFTNRSIAYRTTHTTKKITQNKYNSDFNRNSH
ncbi:hypothetical protein NUSPORA_00211 [Nucleospora cyclopteri]